MTRETASQPSTDRMQAITHQRTSPHCQIRRLTWLLASMLAASSIWAAPETITTAASNSVSPASAPADAELVRAAEDPQRTLATIKADYLYQFLGYVEFTKSTLPQPDSPLVIGVIGADDVFNALADILPMRTINNRSVLRKRLTDSDSLAGIHLLFVGKKVDLTQSPLLKAALTSSVLLVTDAPNGLNAGAVFNFLMIGDHLRFEASLEAADRAGVKISSRVLTLAEHVTGGR